MKIDNVDVGGQRSRPQAGIAAADVVFEEIVEGGITRLLAIYQSSIPDQVGPVRSARTTDPMLLGQFNRPLFAWSGGNNGVIDAVRNGPLVDLGIDTAPVAYERDRDRKAPHNLFVDPADLYGRAPAGAGPPGPIFRYRSKGEAFPANARVVRGVSLDFGGIGSVPVSYRFDPRDRGWRRSQAGTDHLDADGTVVAPQNVVVLFTQYLPSPADARSPEAQSIGTGEAWVLSEGRLIRGTWARAALDQPAALTDAAGEPIELTPGKTWVALPTPGGATVSD